MLLYEVSKYEMAEDDGIVDTFVDKVALPLSLFNEYLQAEIDDKHFRNYVKNGMHYNFAHHKEFKFYNGNKKNRTAYYIVKEVI
jgi:hypothetical protein